MQRLRRLQENIAGIVLAPQLDVQVRQLALHGGVFRIQLQNFLEDSRRLFQVVGLHEGVGHGHVLGAGVVVEALLGVELGQLQDAVSRAGIELGYLFIYGDGFDRETFGAVNVAYFFEVDRGLVVVADARVQVPNGVEDSQVLGVFLDDLFVLIDGVLQLALLHRLFRRGQNLLFVETEP